MDEQEIRERKVDSLVRQMYRTNKPEAWLAGKCADMMMRVEEQAATIDSLKAERDRFALSNRAQYDEIGILKRQNKRFRAKCASVESVKTRLTHLVDNKQRYGQDWVAVLVDILNIEFPDSATRGE